MGARTEREIAAQMRRDLEAKLTEQMNNPQPDDGHELTLEKLKGMDRAFREARRNDLREVLKQVAERGARYSNVIDDAVTKIEELF